MFAPDGNLITTTQFITPAALQQIFRNPRHVEYLSHLSSAIHGNLRNATLLRPSSWPPSVPLPALHSSVIGTIRTAISYDGTIQVLSSLPARCPRRELAFPKGSSVIQHPISPNAVILSLALSTSLSLSLSFSLASCDKYTHAGEALFSFLKPAAVLPPTGLARPFLYRSIPLYTIIRACQVPEGPSIAEAGAKKTEPQDKSIHKRKHGLAEKDTVIPADRFIRVSFHRYQLLCWTGPNPIYRCSTAVVSSSSTRTR